MTGHLLVEEFQGRYRFLSNFYYSVILYKGKVCKYAENAYQAEKAIDPVHQEIIRLQPTPGKAKRKAREMQDQGLTHSKEVWNGMRLGIMEEVEEAKYRQNPNLERKLLLTGSKILEEGNTWGDKFWGICDDEGENHLGLILMKVRDKLREER